MYTIEITYQTGSSFHSEECVDTVGAWPTVELAKDALRAIREHYEAYRELRDSSTDKKEEDYAHRDWYVEGGYKGDWQFTVNVQGYKGKHQLHAFWTGYFERLIAAKVITGDDPDMVYEP